MQEIMRILYDYASSYRLSGSKEDCDQLQTSTKVMEQNLKALRELLNEEEIQRLENYLLEQETVHDIELESMFRAGFSIGQELSRL